MSDTIDTAQASHHWSHVARRRITSLADMFEGKRKNPSFDLQQFVMGEVVAMDAARSAVMIFCNAQSSWKAAGRAFGRPEPPIWRFRPRWLDLANVCHLWRDVALNCSSLWASRATNQFGLQYMSEMLERSKRAPVSLSVDLDSCVTDECDRLVVKHLSHIRAIHFTGDDPRTSSSTPVLELIRSPAPVLEELSVEPSCRAFGTNRLLVLSDDLFSSQAPQLRRLFLVDHFPPLIAPVSPILIRVEHLDISVFPNEIWEQHPKFGRNFMNGQDAVPYLKLLDVLQSMNALQTLTLKRCLTPRIGFASESSQQTLEFPQLKSLDIEDGADECIYFLQCLRIPATATLSIHCILVEITLEPVCSALAPLLRAYLNAAPAPIRTLAVTTPDLHRPTTFGLTTWHTSLAAPELTLRLDVQHRTKGDVADATRFLQVLPLATARTAFFMLRGEFSWNLVLAAAVLRCASAIEELWTNGFSGTAVIAALSPYSAAEGASPAMELPALRVLGVADFDLSAPGLTWCPQTPWMYSEQNYLRLQAFLTALKDAQGQALTLIIEECTVMEPWVEALSELADVEWDGLIRSGFTRMLSLSR